MKYLVLNLKRKTGRGACVSGLALRLLRNPTSRKQELNSFLVFFSFPFFLFCATSPADLPDTPGDVGELVSQSEHRVSANRCYFGFFF